MRRTLINTVLISFLFLTLCALVYTVTRIEIIPEPVFRFFYGMMAPYQGYYEKNSELVAQGRLPDGTCQHTEAQPCAEVWEDISLAPYFSGKLGESTYRQYNLTRFELSEVVMGPWRRSVAEQLLERERERGKEYSAVRLYWREWPKSPFGWYASNEGMLREDNFLIQIP